MQIYKNITELIGSTPLIEASGFTRACGLEARIVVKAEFFNPTGSVKDRIAKAMIRDAEKRGIISKDSVIIEPTSGNTGIGLAAISSAMGYRTIITMPSSMSIERQGLIKAYGAEIVLTDAALGMRGAIAKAEQLVREIKGAFMPSQFTNPANPAAHKATGEEIWRDTDGKIDILVAGVGTGGTVTGAGKYLKSQNSEIKIVAVEPSDSPVLSGGKAGAHGIQGIGAGFVPSTLDPSVYDEIITARTAEAIAAARKIAASDGILVGLSSGAALHAAAVIASRSENAGKLVVVILPDTGERYLSTTLFSV